MSLLIRLKRLNFKGKGHFCLCFREEINRLKREHAEELSHVRISIQDDVDVVRNVRRQEE